MSEKLGGNTYDLKPEDVEQLERFFAELAKDKLSMPAVRVGLFNKVQREQLRQYPNIFDEAPARRKLVFPFNLVRSAGENFVIFFKVIAISSVLLGERTKAKPHYTFDLRRLVVNGMELHILCTILRQSKDQKVLDVLPNEELTSYLYGNAGRRHMWGISFDAPAPQSFPGRGIEEL